jgi:uncharacterized MAPEG superfamily protein
VGLSVWHWVAAVGLLALLCGTKGAVRGGVVVLAVTFFAARLLYLAVTT